MNKFLRFFKKSPTAKKFAVLGTIFTAIAAGGLSIESLPAVLDTVLSLIPTNA